jgi:hypothetical protein
MVGWLVILGKWDKQHDVFRELSSFLTSASRVHRNRSWVGIYKKEENVIGRVKFFSSLRPWRQSNTMDMVYAKSWSHDQVKTGNGLWGLPPLLDPSLRVIEEHSQLPNTYLLEEAWRWRDKEARHWVSSPLCVCAFCIVVWCPRGKVMVCMLQQSRLWSVQIKKIDDFLSYLPPPQTGRGQCCLRKCFLTLQDSVVTSQKEDSFLIHFLL